MKIIGQGLEQDDIDMAVNAASEWSNRFLKHHKAKKISSRNMKIGIKTL